MRHKCIPVKTVFEPAEEGGYTVYVPLLRGCVSEGDTFEEAVENVIEAVELYLEADDWNANLLGHAIASGSMRNVLGHQNM